MSSRTIKINELDVAAQAYFDLYGTERFFELMDLIQEQTPYMQKRYFNVVEALRLERSKVGA